jgi:hypothetical protein
MPELTDADLRDLHIPLGPRKRMLKLFHRGDTQPNSAAQELGEKVSAAQQRALESAQREAEARNNADNANTARRAAEEHARQQTMQQQAATQPAQPSATAVDAILEAARRLRDIGGGLQQDLARRRSFSDTRRRRRRRRRRRSDGGRRRRR